MFNTVLVAFLSWTSTYNLHIIETRKKKTMSIMYIYFAYYNQVIKCNFTRLTPPSSIDIPEGFSAHTSRGESAMLPPSFRVHKLDSRLSLSKLSSSVHLWMSNNHALANLSLSNYVNLSIAAVTHSSSQQYHFYFLYLHVNSELAEVYHWNL